MLDFWCSFAVTFILSCGMAVLQNQAVCDIWKFSGNFSVVSGFLMLFCEVFTRISVRFCGIGTPLTPPSMKNSGWFWCLGYRNTLVIYHVKCFRQSLSSFTCIRGYFSW